MAMKIFWGDCLEKLAEAMFTATQPRTDPFETECTVVGSPVMAGWLKQYFLYDLPKDKKQNRVLAGLSKPKPAALNLSSGTPFDTR